MSPANDQDDAWYPTRRTELRIEDKMPVKNGKSKAPKQRPYAELFRDEAKGFRYRIKGANHEIMVTSESYTKLSDAADGLMNLVIVMVKFGKWYDRDNDSWIHDLTDGPTAEPTTGDPTIDLAVDVSSVANYPHRIGD